MQITLDNGMRLEYRNVPGKLCEAMLIINNGEVAEGIPGSAHILEHVITERAGIGADAGELNYADNNAVTGNEATYYYFTNLFSEDVPSAVARLLTVFDNPEWSTFERERAAIINEMNDKITNQSTFLRKAFELTLPNQSTVVASHIAHRESIRHISVADVKRFWEKRYAPSNACLVIQGAISDEQRAVLGKLASDVAPRQYTPIDVPAAGKCESVTLTEEARTEDSALVKIHYSVPSIQQCGVDGLAQMELAALILADHNAPLYKELRDTRNWAYDVNAWYEGCTSERALFHVETQVLPQEAQNVAGVWQDIIASLAEDGLDHSLFDQLKKKALTFAMQRETKFLSRYFADEVGWYSILGLSAEKYRQAVEAVSFDDVQQFFTLLKFAPRVTAVAMPMRAS